MTGSHETPAASQSRAERSWSRVLALAASIAVIATTALLLVVGITQGDRPADLLWLVLPPLYAVVGAIIVSRSRAGRVGWLLIAISGAIAFESVVALAPLASPLAHLTPAWAVVLVADQISWMLWLFPLFLLLTVFPSGRLLSPRWRWVPILELLMLATLTLLTIFATEMGPFTGAWTVSNPIGFISYGVFESPALLIPWLLGLVALTCGTISSMVMRYRRAGEVERTQIRWVLYAVVVFGLVYAFLLATSGWSDESLLPAVALVVGVAGIAAAILVAVLRFHLYEIDVIISRSLTFGVLAVFIGGVYVGIVVGVGALLDRGDGSSVGLSVAATAVVAIGFQPVRVRVERWANRLVYGKRATPYEVLARFSHRAIDDDDDTVVERIPQLIVDGTGAARATLWIASDDGFHMASVWPEAGPMRTITTSEGAFDDPDADLSLPVFHDGELLGGISLVAARGATITPPERELVTRLADGLGLSLRNGRLTATLRRQIDDLQRSRDRLVTAADEARRSLERDLDRGPQQRLITVQTQLASLRQQAETAGATKTAAMLTDLESDVGDTIDAVRDFASGVYPPLLNAEGLAVALTHETRKAAIPIHIHADNIDRYTPDIEAAAYFSVLEALQNTAKYANATHATVTLTHTNNHLTITITDNGTGFDPTTTPRGAGLNSITDRIDTNGGTTTITSSPGNGTTITATIPTPNTNHTPTAVGAGQVPGRSG